MKYKIVLETIAAIDLRGILDYISDILLMPKTAARIFFSIEERIMSLDNAPKR